MVGLRPRSVRLVPPKGGAVIEPAEHCGHSCCNTPHEPHHDHFLTPDECPRCVRIAEGAEVVAAGFKRIGDLLSDAERAELYSDLAEMARARKRGAAESANWPMP